MSGITDDIRIREIKPLITPNEVMGEFAATETAVATVTAARSALHNILHGAEDRLVAVTELAIFGHADANDTHD